MQTLISLFEIGNIILDRLARHRMSTWVTREDWKTMLFKEDIMMNSILRKPVFGASDEPNCLPKEDS